MAFDEVHEWIFTFGFGHAYPNSFITIIDTEVAARERMIARFGNRWSMQYRSRELAGVKRHKLEKLEFNV